MFPLPGGSLAGAVPAVSARGRCPKARVPCGAEAFLALQRSSVAGPTTLRSSSAGPKPRPCGSGPRRLSSSAEAVNESWSPGDYLSLVSPSSRPDRGPGGHSPRSRIVGPGPVLTPFQDSGPAFRPSQRSGWAFALPVQSGCYTLLGSGRAFALPGFSQTFRSASLPSTFASGRVVPVARATKTNVRANLRTVK